MHILMLSDVYFPRINGVSTSIQTFVTSFLALGHEVTLIAPEYPQDTASDARVIRIPSRRLPFDPEDRLMSLRAVKRLLPQLAQREFDLIHIQTPFIAHYAGIWLARKLGIKTLTTYHTFFEAYLEKYLPLVPGCWLRGIARLYSRRQCNEVDAVISPSHQMLERLREYGVTTRAAVIPTGLPASSFADSGSDGFRAAHRISEDAILLLYVGRVAFEKNIDFLIDMFGHVRKEVPRAMLLIAGEGPAMQRLRVRTADTKRHNRIRFIGYLDRTTELPACYRASDLFVFASQTETQGLVLLEAMAAGLPVVSLASMGSLDVLHEGEGAVISPPDTRVFAGHVARLAQDVGRRHALGTRGKVYAAGWRADAKAGEMLAFYDAVLDPHPVKAPNTLRNSGPRLQTEED
jgi:glycosyltransferase involved in cell wall biosynthesis